MQTETHRCYFGVVDEERMTIVTVGFKQVKYQVLREGVCVVSNTQVLLRCSRRAKYDYSNGVIVGFRQVKYLVLRVGVCRSKRTTGNL